MSVRARDDTMSLASSYTAGEDPYGDVQGDQERIFVSIRVRPLNEKEISRNKVSDWECINSNTIIFKTNMPERSMFPTAYTFDRVFGSECPTEQVYDEGAREIALSAVSGINSTIFAYGQTSSGKTYTMTGITEYAVADMYEYIEKHKEREFVLKFSAMEIYNEAVRDLLSSDSTPLRVLDDPERGTVVEKLTEETLIDWNHLQELLYTCEAQRQIGETSLNETSSRSHQILRLTVQSSAREYSGAGTSSTLMATVNFVDLAGSERSSQAFTAGFRLKEGSHINRSLLTLGTVIRKLSKGRNVHVPYRDSKLTRILQNSLGGNARTAIICTMSPARSHVEQSRNTLMFASRAKEVTTNAHVNVVMSDKVLVKQLQMELTKLENQLRSKGSISSSGDSASRLREKELLIEQMDKEIKELIWQRDLAQSRVETLLKSVGEDRVSRMDEISASETSEVVTPLRLDLGLIETSACKDFDDSKQSLQSYGSLENNFLPDKGDSRVSENDPSHACEEISRRKSSECDDTCKDVRCIDTEETSINGERRSDPLSPISKQREENSDFSGPMNEVAASSIKNEDKVLIRINSANTYDSLKQKIQELHKTIDYLELSPLRKKGASSSKSLRWTRTTSRRSILMTIPSWLWPDKEERVENENTPSENCIPEEQEKEEEEAEERIEQTPPQTSHDDEIHSKSRDDTQQSVDSHSTEESIKEIDVHLNDNTGARENKITKHHSENLTADVPVPETSSKTHESRKGNKAIERGNSIRQHHTNWPIKFERYRRKILELWARCNVPLVHRSYFFLLFKGDPSDNVYMEVELRRLYFLKDTSSQATNAFVHNQMVSSSASTKALNRERESLAKQMQKKYTKRERENLYQKWGIDLDTKQRSLKLARLLWTDNRDMKHIKESANLVAKLFGIVEPRYAPKEMFGLSFITPSSMAQRPTSWRDNMSSLL